MARAIDDLMDQYDRGTLTRRQLVTGLLAALSGVAFPGKAAAQTGAPLAPVRSINHLHFAVSNHQRSADFYSALFGAKIRDKGKTLWTMTFPNSTSSMGSWISLDTGGGTHKPGTYNHMGLGVDLPSPDSTKKLADEINKRFPFAKARPTGPTEPQGTNPGGRSIYMYDPDGLYLQLNAPKDDGWLPNGQK